MYEMYRWDQADPGTASARRKTRPPTADTLRGVPVKTGLTPPAGAVSAVQVALDRRDNGGDSGAPRDQ